MCAAAAAAAALSVPQAQLAWVSLTWVNLDLEYSWAAVLKADVVAPSLFVLVDGALEGINPEAEGRASDLAQDLRPKRNGRATGLVVVALLAAGVASSVPVS